MVEEEEGQETGETDDYRLLMDNGLSKCRGFEDQAGLDFLCLACSASNLGNGCTMQRLCKIFIVMHCNEFPDILAMAATPATSVRRNTPVKDP